MDSFFNSLNEFFLVFEDILTNYVLVYFLIGAGIFLTVKLSFPQILRIKTAFKQIGRKLNGGLNSKSGISSFEALATAIAAQVGTGNGGIGFLPFRIGQTVHDDTHIFMDECQKERNCSIAIVRNF